MFLTAAVSLAPSFVPSPIQPSAAHEVDPCDDSVYVLLFFYGNLKLYFHVIWIARELQHPVYYLVSSQSLGLLAPSNSFTIWGQKIPAAFTCKEVIVMCNITLVELHILKYSVTITLTCFFKKKLTGFF